MKPTGFAAAAGPPPRDVAIFQASQHRTAAPHHLRAFITAGLSRMTRPSPNATPNIMSPIPTVTPRRHGRPRTTPTLAPVAVRIALLGPGVPAAATEKATNARI